MASEGLHEPEGSLSGPTVDRHRAIVSLREELEAVDWYDQRVEATDDASLAALLAHNRDEEKEHAAMVLEWLRRHDPVLDRHLRTYLFTDAPITALEHASELPGAEPPPAGAVDPGAEHEQSSMLRIGSLREAP
jgi:ferritin-like protein